jgi:tetratricopeptide (TPR) repeat protein
MPLRRTRQTSGTESLPRRISVLLLLVLSLAWPARAGEVVPTEFRVTDFATRTALARLLAGRSHPGDRVEALRLYSVLREELPDQPAELLELAVLAADLGSWRAARDLAEHVAAHPDADGRTRLAARDLGSRWGAFRAAGAAWDGRLREDPADMEAALGLAKTLLARQRLDDARGLVQGLLRGPAAGKIDVAAEAWALLARIEFQAKDFPAAVQAAQQALDAGTGDARTRLLLAEARWRSGQLREAQAAAMDLAQDPATREEALLLEARIRLAQGDAEGALEAADQVLSENPDNPRARVLVREAGGKVQADAHLEAEAQLVLGQSLAESGHTEEAVQALRAVLARDPDLDPARVALAEALSTAGRYGEALEVLDGLVRDFPQSDKFLLARARVLGWDRRYAESLAAYADLSRSDPGDPVPRREAARVAYWAKDPERGQELYAGLWSRPVDLDLAERLQDLGGPGASDAGVRTWRSLVESAEHGTSWDGYEAVQKSLADLTPAEQAAVQAALADLSAEYRAQKAAGVEARAKDMAYNGRFNRAGRALEELTQLEPGNEEALFDLAQARCTQGLCDQEAAAYRRLLDLDPLHTLAGYALARHDLRSSPALGAQWRMWDEEGRGDLARMTRHRGQAWAEAPFLEGRGTVRLGQDLYVETPRLRGSSEEASGQTLKLSGVASEFLSGDGELSRKDFADPDLDDHWLGRASATLNVDDYARLRLSFRREDVLPNDFALRQGIAADTWRADASPLLGRRLSARLGAERTRYSDGVAGDTQDAEVGYAFTDHPRILKVILSGERRDTAEKSGFFYEGERLVAVRHPYWTPQDYYGGAFTLEWNHDLAMDQFCGAPANVYDIKASLGQDTDHNPSFRLEGIWRVDLDERWSLELGGMVHESDQWDARAAYLGLSVRLGPQPGRRR